MSRRQSFSSLGATSLEDEASVLARHASAEAMRLCASSIVWLKSALRHRNEFSLKTKRVRLAAPCVYVKEVRVIRVKPYVERGDQWVLFYSATLLDQSETSMLVSARSESRHPVSN
jgi:hypothetical protein